MKIGFGSDHAAIELKACLIEHLTEKGFECVDFGEAIRRGEVEKGVLVCGTGVGISLAANKVPGIRAGVCSDCFTAKMITEHNHCQIIAMGQRVVGTELAKMMVDNFFGAEQLGGRHAARVDMISQIERDYGYADAPVK